jgi:AsmA protein
VVNLATDQIDYSLRASLIGTATGEGGAELEKLKGVTIPIKISGTTADPKFKPDFGKIAKEQLQRQIEKQIEKQLGTDKQPNAGSDKSKKDAVKDAVKKLLKF